MKQSLQKNYPKYTSFLLCIGLWLADGSKVFAQNLVPNPGFEVDMGCPVFVDCDNDQSPCPPWLCIASSVNFFNSCTTGTYGVPDNFRGHQYPHGGEGYAGGYQKISHEYNQVQLLQPLIAAKCYYASMYVNLSDESCGIDHLGMLFTEELIPNPTGRDPQIDGSGQFYTDTANWMLISGTFIALGGEEYLSIGNFSYNNATQYHPDCAPFAQYAYYYFDDIYVEQLPTDLIDVELGGPYVECNSLILDPHVPGASYYWSDGSTDSTLVVTTSGTYSVTVYSAEDCSAGIAETEVTILGSPDVVLGPDQILCDVETYTIQLDQAAGDYLWSDGSDDAQFTISTPGIYSVTLDDGCDISIDFIEVTYLSIPSFTLGEDTLLCPGESYSLALDPMIGEFLWHDNSNYPTYTIDEVGMYALTVSNLCGEYSDEIEVTSIDSPVFTLGPDSTVVCLGNNIALQFDPALGDFLWQDGSTGPAFTITSTGLYSLTVSNPCGILSDEIYVQQITVPVVVLGGSLVLCAGETEILDPGSNYGDYVWQDGSTEQEYIVSSPGTYSITVTNACGTDTDSILVNVLSPLLPPDLGPDVILCNGEQLVLAVPQQVGTIQWNDFSNKDTLLVTVSGTYYVKVSTVCESYSDTVVVTFQDNAPVVNLPPDFAICQGQTTLLDAGINNVSYLWNDGSQFSQLTVSSPGVYSVIVTNNCGTDTDSIMIFNGGLAPVVSLGPDTSICPGNTLLLFPSYAHVSEWNWSDGSDTTFFLASTSGLVFVDVSNDCGTFSDTMMIGLLPSIPALSLGPDTAICPGETVTISITFSDVTILWQDGNNNQDYIVNDSLMVIASISNSCGVSIDSLEVDLLPAVPLLNLGPDQTLCPGETITLDPGITDVQYLWQDGSTSSLFQTTLPDTVTLMITNICGSATDSIQITASTIGPQVDLGPDLHACIGTSVSIPAGILGVHYMWQDGSNDDTYITSSSGTYYLTVDNLCGSDSDTIVVDISGLPPSVMLGPDTMLCAGSTLTLSSSADSSSTIQWQDGSTFPVFEVLESGEYYLIVSNQCGTVADTIDVNISGIAPVVDLGPDTILCEGSTLLLTSNADVFTSTTWQDGSTASSFEIVISGTYHLTQSNACGMDSDTIIIEMNGTPPTPDLGADTTLCEGNTLLLASTADPEITSVWKDGTSALTYLVASPGIYTLMQINHCGERTDTLTVMYQSPPDPFDLGPDTTLCPGKTLLLTSPFTTDHIEWQDGSLTSSLLVSQAGKYTLTIENECGITSDEIDVMYDDQLIHFTLDDHAYLCEGDVLVLDASQTFAATYIWNTGSSLPSITITNPDDYSVTVITDCQQDMQTITVIQNTDCNAKGDIYIPNVFSPNGDNINDQFIIVTGSDINIVSIEGTIFDRWGEIVYMSTQNPFIWDGRLGDDNVQPGVYVYLLRLKYTRNGQEYFKQLAGDVTIVR